MQAPVLDSRKTLAPKPNEPDSRMRNALRLENADLVGLEMAARSFARKRQLKRKEWIYVSISVSCADSSRTALPCFAGA